ncbi:hypothetical protein SHPE106448_19795 [Shewanella pealeana]
MVFTAVFKSVLGKVRSYGSIGHLLFDYNDL